MEQEEQEEEGKEGPARLGSSAAQLPPSPVTAKLHRRNFNTLPPTAASLL